MFLGIVETGIILSIMEVDIMNKMRKNLKKIVSCLALVVAMLVTSVPAHAAGIEDWNYGTGPEENIRVTNNNLTPVKTITHTGTLTIEYLTLPCKPGYSHCGCSDSEPFSYPAVKATVQIREAYTGRVLATSTTNEMDFNAKVSAYVIKVNTKITKKGKIKITNLDNFLLYRIVKVFYFI